MDWLLFQTINSQDITKICLLCFCRSSPARSGWISKESAFVINPFSCLDHHRPCLSFQNVLQQVLSSDVQHFPGTCIFWSCLVLAQTGILHWSLYVDGFPCIQQTHTCCYYCPGCFHFNRPQEVEKKGCHDDKDQWSFEVKWKLGAEARRNRKETWCFGVKVECHLWQFQLIFHPVLPQSN